MDDISSILMQNLPNDTLSDLNLEDFDLKLNPRQKKSSPPKFETVLYKIQVLALLKVPTQEESSQRINPKDQFQLNSSPTPQRQQGHFSKSFPEG